VKEKGQANGGILMAPTGVGRKQKSNHPNLDDLQPNSSSHAKGVYKCL
jgi:hypothetical protein